MSTTSPLPPNWTAILEQIQQTLTQATHLAEAREAALADQASPNTPLIAPGLIAKHLEGLHQRVQHIHSPLDAFDKALQDEEDHVRRHLGTVAELRQRLADWAGRAIG